MAFWYFKHLHAYTAVRTIGPKMVMIRKMLVEMVIFLIVFLAFMFAFGISVMALAYHNQILNLDLLMNIFFPSFFIIGGNYYTRDTFLFGKYLYLLKEILKFILLFNVFLKPIIVNEVTIRVLLLIFTIRMIVPIRSRHILFSSFMLSISSF